MPANYVLLLLLLLLNAPRCTSFCFDKLSGRYVPIVEQIVRDFLILGLRDVNTNGQFAMCITLVGPSGGRHIGVVPANSDANMLVADD